MIINLFKFIHILFVLLLSGATVFCLLRVTTNKASMAGQQPVINGLSIFILLCTVLAVFTGTVLIYPKNFTFHTPWIQAAYLFAIIFSIGVLLLMLCKQKLQNRWLLGGGYFFLLLILVFLVHDAVTKTTFLFSYV